MIPKLSTPLTKLIRTGEGIVLFAFNVAGVVLTAVGDLAPGVAVKYAAIFNAVAFASRSALKAVAAAKPAVGDPAGFKVGAQSSEQVLAEIEAAAKAVETFQSKPGTPPDQLAAGLAPDFAERQVAPPAEPGPAVTP